MMNDILLQAGLILLSIVMYLAMHNIPQKTLAKLREYRGRAGAEAKRHFVMGAQLLARARSPSIPRSHAISLAKQAEDEATKSIQLDPKDAAAHILKALALDLQGFKTSALDSLHVALSPLAVKSLTDDERGDALFKRAELVMGTTLSTRVDSAIADLTQAVKLKQENANAFRLLGECYEEKKMSQEAINAYEAALKLQPHLKSAQDAVVRLNSTD
ncbi:Tetratricopeptide repeat (TPR)-like superfamily protein [Euphorbia peplus]|nr:Tetratricopeptide repeat (TPR)-like superfamily protein [Euphorbia peplus]